MTLAPGQSRAYGLRFLVADAIPNIEKTLAAADRPVAVGIPGYIVPMDLEAKLFLAPGKRKVARVDGRACRRADGDAGAPPRRAASCSTSCAA